MIKFRIEAPQAPASQDFSPAEMKIMGRVVQIIRDYMVGEISYDQAVWDLQDLGFKRGEAQERLKRAVEDE